MSQGHGKDAQILIGSYEASTYFRSGSVSEGIDTADVTTFTKEDHEFLAGQGNATLTLDGIFDTAYAATLDGYAQSTGEVLGLFPQGDAVGSRGRAGLIKQTNHGVSAVVGGAVAASYQAVISGGWDAAVSLHSNAAAETAAGTGTTTFTPAAQWLNLPGVNGHADSDYTTAITTEITISARVTIADLTPAADACIVSQYGAAGNINCAFMLDTTGVLLFDYSTDGTAVTEIPSTANISTVATIDTPIWLRVHHDNDDGANAVTKFYYSYSDATDESLVTWTQLGSTVSGAQLAARFSSTYAWKAGITATTANDWVGRIYQASVRAGTPTAALVMNPQFDDASQWTVGEDASDTADDDQGNTWTLTDDATIAASAATTNGGAAYIWCTTFSAVDFTARVEHSADNASWATLGTFSQLTAIGSQQLVIAEGTTVNRYLRTVWVTTGGITSIKFTVAFGRR